MSSMKTAEKSTELAFASIVYPQRNSEIDAILLAESVRKFAGSLSDNSLIFYTPKDETTFSKGFIEKISNLNAELFTFSLSNEYYNFPFMSNAFAATCAEEDSINEVENIAWLSPNTIVLREPEELILKDEIILGYRPVHHKLIGSKFEEPLDPFWKAIYEVCDVEKDHIFPMETHIEGVKIRPYFNAGILSFRPNRRLMKGWRDKLIKVYKKPSLQEFYNKDEKYKIFLHQAILTGVILSKINSKKIYELPVSYNYPFHLHNVDITSKRPNSMNEMITIRHEGFYNNSNWFEKFPAHNSLKVWIHEKIIQMQRS